MTQTITMTYKILHHYRERLFTFLIATILMTAAAYGFFLQEAIVNVVEREKVLSEVVTKSTEVGSLEAKYFTLKNSITLEMARGKGFKDAQVSAYIQKKSVTAMASNNEL